MTAKDVFDSAAALLNDTALSIFTYDVQMPYLNMALAELEEYYELNNIPVTNATSSAITVPAGTTEVGFQTVPAQPATVPVLPAGLIEIQKVWERPTGVDPYVPMVRVEFLPQYLNGTLQSNFLWWAWQDQKIKVLEANQSNDIKLDYIKSIFTPVVDESDPIDVINSKTALSYRTAALCAQFIGENKERSDDLNSFASIALDRLIGIGAKGRQAIATRRRPFLSSWKMTSGGGL